MAETSSTVLDHIGNIKVPGEVFTEPVNEYWALLWLWDGMEWLYRQASKIDQMVKQRVNPDGKKHVVCFGGLPDFGQFPRTLLTSAFHWYAISACQYVRTVSRIAYGRHQSPPRAKDRVREYVETVIPEVLAFRDKVAAHFVWALDDNRDNDAERLASIMPQLTFVDDSFHVGVFAVEMRSSGKTSDSQAIKPWSICRVHHQLRQRYWPDRALLEKETTRE
jgi:hypothetical protein